MKILLLVLSVFIVGCEANKLVSEYKGICEVFNEAVISSEKITAEIILINLKQKVGEESQVFKNWATISFMPPNRQKKSRYNAFKKIAEEDLGMGWECLSMQTLADTFPAAI